MMKLSDGHEIISGTLFTSGLSVKPFKIFHRETPGKCRWTPVEINSSGFKY